MVVVEEKLGKRSDEALCKEINEYWRARGVEANARVAERSDTFPEKFEQVVIGEKDGRTIYEWKRLKHPLNSITVKSVGIVTDLNGMETDTRANEGFRAAVSRAYALNNHG